MSRSFNVDARKVRNPDLPMRIRKAALITCMTLTSEHSFQDLIDALTVKFGIHWGSIRLYPITEQQLIDAIAYLEAEHNRYLERLLHFERKRIREKAQGKRQPSRVDIEALYLRGPFLVDDE